jgi:hypothetical protein
MLKANEILLCNSTVLYEILLYISGAVVVNAPSEFCIRLN